jgi:hypothetical protein
MRSVLAVAVVALIACGKSEAATNKKPTATGATSAAPAAAPAGHAEGDNYKIDTSSSCSGSDCTITIRLEALGGYHINDSYPYKFKTNPADGVTYKTADGVFGRASGHFSKDSATVATVKVEFTATKSTTVTGTFKMSVCSDDNCQLEQPDLSIDVSR